MELMALRYHSKELLPTDGIEYIAAAHKPMHFGPALMLVLEDVPERGFFHRNGNK